MKVVNMGNIAEACNCDDLPSKGIVIEATEEELANLPNLVYKDVEIKAKEGDSKIVAAFNGFRKSLPNPPPRKLNHVTRKLEHATRIFLNDLDYCVAARSRNMVECKDWMNEMSDQLCALRASYNRIFDNRNAKGGAK